MNTAEQFPQFLFWTESYTKFLNNRRTNCWDVLQKIIVLLMFVTPKVSIKIIIVFFVFLKIRIRKMNLIRINLGTFTYISHKCTRIAFSNDWSNSYKDIISLNSRFKGPCIINFFNKFRTVDLCIYAIETHEHSKWWNVMFHNDIASNLEI